MTLKIFLFWRWPTAPFYFFASWYLRDRLGVFLFSILPLVIHLHSFLYTSGHKTSYCPVHICLFWFCALSVHIIIHSPSTSSQMQTPFYFWAVQNKHMYWWHFSSLSFFKYILSRVSINQCPGRACWCAPPCRTIPASPAARRSCGSWAGTSATPPRHNCNPRHGRSSTWGPVHTVQVQKTWQAEKEEKSQPLWWQAAKKLQWK